MNLTKVFGLAVLMMGGLFAQADSIGAIDQSSVLVSRGRLFNEPVQPLYHPYHIEARHADGTLFYVFDGHNLRTSAGTTWQADIMGNTSTPSVNTQCNYIALTNTAITAAEADTTLSGEISSNGLSRAQGTYANASTTLTVPSAPTATIVGTTGAVTYNYWVAACNQSICTTPSVTSNQLTTANATLSTTAYVKVTWTPIAGAAAYQVYRTTSGSAPSGTSSVLVGGTAGCDTTTCTQYDISNTLTSVVIPASNLTNFGKFTLAKTFTATGAQSAQAFGIFSASSSGTMCFEGTFTQVSLNTSDTLTLTESVFF